MTYTQYAALDGLNFSSIKHMRDCPAAYKANRDAAPRDGDTDSRAMLRLQHALALEPHTVDQDFVFWTGGLTQTGKPTTSASSAAYKEAAKQAEADGKTLVKAATGPQLFAVAAAQELAGAVRRHPHVAHALATGRTEVVIQGHDSEWGRPIKSRQDLLSPAWWLDMKDYGSTEARHCGRMAYKLGAVHQTAFNRRCLVAAGEPLPERWGLICVQTKPWIDVSVQHIDPNDIDAAERELTAWVAELAECEASGNWPGRGDGMLSLPGHAFAPDINDFTFAIEE